MVTVLGWERDLELERFNESLSTCSACPVSRPAERTHVSPDGT